MTNRMQLREIGAWMVLVFAIVLLSISIAVSQTKTINIENENGKAHIKISKTENGVTTRFDTTFEVNDNTDIDKVIEKLGESHGEKIVIDSRIHKVDSKKGIKDCKIMIDLDLPELSEADKERFHDDIKKSMKEMKNGLKEMQQSLKNLHIQIDNDSDDDFSFDFNYPDVNIPEKNDHDSHYRSYKYSFNDDIDSIGDDDHVVIVGKSGENPPVLEKVITSKNGKQIFIYKRSLPDNQSEIDKVNSDQKIQLPGLENIRYYPNPTDGKLTVSFQSTSKNDISIKILDDTNKEVFKDNLNNYSGEYLKEIDLSGISKGNYFLKISTGKKAVSMLVVVN